MRLVGPLGSTGHRRGPARGIVSVAVMMPVPLSYFSPLVGGLPGATALGMEPTYYWDALSPDACRWLFAHTEAAGDHPVRQFPAFLALFATYRGPAGASGPDRSRPPKWYVLQNRPGAFSPLDRALATHGRAAFTVTKLGVPLVWIFPFSEIERVSARLRE